MRVPVVVLAGVDPVAVAATTVALQFDLPDTVVVRHHIAVDRQVLTRTVSDAGGALEERRVELEHACVTCAIREDIVPTLDRLARDGRWQSVVVHLPVGAEPRQLCTVLAQDSRLARFLRVSAVVTVVSAAHPVRDLLGDDLLVERGHHCSHDDTRGVGEVLSAMVEYADAVVFDGPVQPVARGLVETLARPGAEVVEGAGSLEVARLVGRLHQHSTNESWVAPARRGPLPLVPAEGVWQVDLRSPLPFHPGRLLTSIESIGGGAHRSRGCFWLPTRPGQVLQWDGAGGQLSIGQHGSWGQHSRLTRLVVTGVGIAPPQLRHAFADLLVRPGEDARLGDGGEDGFEPWLGPIRRVA